MRFNQEAFIKAMHKGFFTNVKLGEAAQVSPTTIQRARNGLDMKPSTAQKICSALGVSFEQVAAKDK